jgi:phosphate transport system substrate-binding protein
MAVLAFAAVALLFAGAAEAAALAGGATSVTSYISNDVIPGFNKQGKGTFPAYDSVGSSQGIQGFNNGTFALGFSDVPQTTAQDAQAPSGGKLTIPFVLETASFITKKASGLKISGYSLSRVYLGIVTTWSNFGEGSATIIPVCRSDGSGTTELITIYFKAQNSAWPSAYVGQNTLLGGPFNKNLVGESGSSGVVNYVAGNANAIGYAQSGLATGQASEIGINNPAGQFVFATQANPVQSIPRTLPGYNQSWASVTLEDQPGAQTYPIASFVYSFIRDTYAGSKYAGTNAALAKNFLLYSQTSSVQNSASAYFFFAIPTSLTGTATTAINKVVT